MAVEHLDTCLSIFVNSLQVTIQTCQVASLTTTHGSNLAAAVYAAADDAAPHRDIGEVNKALVIVTTAEGIAAVLQSAFAL